MAMHLSVDLPGKVVRRALIRAAWAALDMRPSDKLLSQWNYTCVKLPAVECINGVQINAAILMVSHAQASICVESVAVRIHSTTHPAWQRLLEDPLVQDPYSGTTAQSDQQCERIVRQGPRSRSSDVVRASTPERMRLASVRVMPAAPAASGSARRAPSHLAAASNSLSGGACGTARRRPLAAQ